MYKKLLFFLLLTISINQVICQIDTTKVMNRKIDLKSSRLEMYEQGMPPTFFTWHKYKFVDEDYSKFRNIGIFGNNLRPYLSSNPDALVYLDKYGKTRKAGVTQMVLGPVLTIVGIGIAINHTNNLEENAELNMPNSVPILAVGGGLLFLSGSITYSFGTTKKIWKAIEIYNNGITN